MNELEAARKAVVMRLIGQRDGVDLTRNEQFVAREIVQLLNVLLLEKQANE
jgi:hypothetical protein